MITVAIETHTFPAVGMENVTTETVGMMTRMQDANAMANGISLDIERDDAFQDVAPRMALYNNTLTVIAYRKYYTI